MSKTPKMNAVYEKLDGVPEGGRAEIPVPFLCESGVVNVITFRMYMSKYCAKNNCVMTSKLDERSGLLHVFRII